MLLENTSLSQWKIKDKMSVNSVSEAKAVRSKYIVYRINPTNMLIK